MRGQFVLNLPSILQMIFTGSDAIKFLYECWRIVNKHGRSAFVANNFLTRFINFKASGAQCTSTIDILSVTVLKECFR